MDKNMARVFKMSFGSIYPLYIEKAEKKGRTRREVDQVIFWLTGYRDGDLKKLIAGGVDFEGFFTRAPRLPTRS